MKNEFDKYIGKVILVNLPNTKRARHRWIVRKRDDGRYIVGTPKIGIRIGELGLLRNDDFGKEILLPKNSKPNYTAEIKKSKI
jgi:hypothetical protein